MISGGSLVRKDVPPFTKAAKEPLSYVGINSVGPEEEVLQRKKLKKFKIFTEFYIKKIITPHKQELLKQMEATPERDEILDFIRNSSQVKGYDKILLKKAMTWCCSSLKK
jgi:UDP-N-acetylglucosamine acyltransferase